MPVTIGGSGPITGVTSINTSVSDTELGYLDGVTSAIQSQINTAGGLVKITDQSFSAASSVSVNNCFTSTYENYRIIISTKGSTLAGLRFRARASGSDFSGATNYRRSSVNLAASTTPSGINETGTEGYIGSVTSAAISVSTIDINAPLSTEWKTLVGQNITDDYFHNYGIVLRITSASDGFSIYPSTGTITGTLRVYGYRN